MIDRKGWGSRGLRWVRSVVPARERGGDPYAALRPRLVRMFEWRGAVSPGGLADETIERSRRRLEHGEAIGTVDRVVYVYGVARSVLEEHASGRRPTGSVASTAPAPAAAAVAPASVSPASEGDREHRARCLERCLASLPGESRQLVEDGYRWPDRERAVSRRELAAALGISTADVRMRAHRMRRTLEACVHECMRRRSAEAPVR